MWAAETDTPVRGGVRFRGEAVRKSMWRLLKPHRVDSGLAEEIAPTAPEGVRGWPGEPPLDAAVLRLIC